MQTAREPVSHRWVWIGLIGLALLVLGVFVAGYWFLVRYEDKVARHVPAGTVAALRLDVEQVVLYQPIRKHVFAMLDGAETRSDRLEQLKAETGVNLGMDLREIMVTVSPEGQYLVAIGGLFPQSGLLEKTLKVVPAERGCVLRGNRVSCVVANRTWWIEQAHDGVVLASNSEQLLAAALPDSDEGLALGLQEAPITLTLRWKQALSGLPVGVVNLGLPQWVTGLQGVFAQADLGDPLQVQVMLQGVEATQLGAVRDWLRQVQTLTSLVPGPDWAGERDALARASVGATPNGQVALQTTWQRKDLDRAARVFADWFQSVAANNGNNL